MREPLLILHFIGLALGLGTNITLGFLGSIAAKMEKEEREAFMMKYLKLSILGQSGMVLLLVTGLALSAPIGSTLHLNHFFMAKIVVYIVLLVLISLMMRFLKKAKKENGGPALYAIRKVNRIMTIFIVTILVLAVLAFK
ncbi:MAG: hypothetical protein OCC49_13025 [Fibrobacterales bacterium]